MIMTKLDIIKTMKLDELGNYDTALPQQWLNAAADKLEEYGYKEPYQTLLAGTVWFYPKQSGYCGGYPFPLTLEAAKYLSLLQ